MKQFITITDDGVSYQIPDAFITAKIQNEYKNLPKFLAFGRAVEDYINSERAKGEQQEA